MKSIGIVRKIDELGRIVLPIELRKTLEISEKDPLEIYVEGDAIILKSISPPAFSAASGKTFPRIRTAASAPTVCATSRANNGTKAPVRLFAERAHF